MPPLTYRPEIDGLRAFAVIPVILFHMGTEWLPGGFIGVDVFFVISGFLITKIILKEFHQGIFRFRNFWLRRIRRIIPAMLTMVMLTSVVGYGILYGPDMNDLGKQGVASSISAANFYFWRLTGDYWGLQAEYAPLLHTWTLSVEEQFYLFYPLLLVLTLRFYKNLLIPLAVILITLSVILFLYGIRHFPSATFYLLPTRAWELGSGCLLAVLDSKNYFQKYSFLKPRIIALLSSIGLMAIILAYIFISGAAGLSALLVIPVLGALLTIAFSQDKKSFANRILTLSPIVYIGKISYSLYLWHWPVFFYTKHFYLDGHTVFTPVGSIPVLLALSVASYHLVEKPARQKRNVLLPISVSFVGVIAFSVFLSVSDFSEDVTIYSETTWNGKLYNVVPYREGSDFDKKRLKGITVPTPDLLIRNSFAEGGIIKPYNRETPEVVILGDSHAVMWSGILDEICKELNVSVSFYGALATWPFFNIPIEKTKGNIYFNPEEKYIFDEMRVHFLEKWKPRVVIIAASWAGSKNVQETQDLIRFLDGIGSRIIFIEQPPVLFFGDRNAPQYLSYMGVVPQENVNKYIPGEITDQHKIGVEFLQKVSLECTHCEVIPVADIFLSEDNVWVLDGLDVLYRDDDHLSSKGTSKAKNRIKQAIQNHFSTTPSIVAPVN